MDIEYRPMRDNSWTRPRNERRYSQFSAPWPTTLRELRHEIEHLDGKNVVFEVDAAATDFRADGNGLKVRATFYSPAVIVAFDSKHGHLRYPADGLEARYYGEHDYRHNVRAVALTLQALRAIDRYGGIGGQQYGGYLELEATAAGFGPEAAKDIIHKFSGMYPGDKNYTTRNAFRRAKAYAHPDKNDGDQQYWDQVMAAGKVLGL